MNVAKRIVLALGAFLLGVSVAQAGGDRIQPFTLAYATKSSVAATAEQAKSKLTAAGFEIVGEYSPYQNARVIGVTSTALKQAAGKSKFGGYGAVQRVAVTKVEDEVQVSYANPVYMANVYRMARDLADVRNQLAQALGAKKDYGSAKGLAPRKLRKYHYMFGMEYFDDYDDHRIATHGSYEEAIKMVEANLAKGTAGVTKVYRVDIPGKQETVFGVAMKKPEGGSKFMDDAYIMSVIDFQNPRATAHLPYEILVSGNEVYSLYARFRIAINFPDLSMMGSNSFMNIMESPETLKKALTQAAGGKVVENYWDQQ